MKVLQVNNFHYYGSGTDRIYLETGKLLKSKGHEVYYFSTSDEKNIPSEQDRYFVNNFNFLNASKTEQIKSLGRFIYSKAVKKNLERLITDLKPDLAHLHIFFGRLSNSILPVLRKHNIPVIMTLHEYKLVCPVYTLLNADGKICERCVHGNYLPCIIQKCNRHNFYYSTIAALESYIRDWFFAYEKNIERFICVSRFMTEKMQSLRPAHAKKFIHINNFIDLSQYEFTLEKHDYYLYFGRISREKGIFTMLETFRSFPEIRLIIVGEGAILDAARTFVKEHEIRNVEFLGYISGKPLIEIISKAKFVIVPSEWYETFGLVAIESMAAGTPVIASSIGAIPEIIESGKTGFLFESRNPVSMSEAIKRSQCISENEYKSMAFAARQCVENNYDTEKYYASLMNVYQQTLAEKEFT
jgi:glycosyltransferase involved in cell wall biosynthesis